MSTYTDASLIVTPNAKKSSKLYALKGSDLDVVRATTATYVGSDGLIKTALANEVRFDYSNGSCPSILVEPQRTNLLLRSQEFDNAYWTKQNSTTISNQAIAPDGTNTAELLYPNSTGTFRGVRINVAVSSVKTYTFSFFAKASGFQWLRIRSIDDSAIYANFDVLNGVVGIVGSGLIASITPFQNGWFRCVVIGNSSSTIASCYIIFSDNNGTGAPSATANGTNGVLLWGAQLEEGSNATSYIPTVASAVTRNADVISKTGLSGITSITETFENGTTNVISGSPTSYTMSQGRIKHVIGI